MDLSVSGATLVCGVMGAPVRHSLSPVIHNAAFRAMGLDWTSLAFEVADGDAETAVRGMRSLDIQGLSVTMPHKATVVPALDALAPSAERLGVVNCIHNDGGRLVGHSTDGAGFVAAVHGETDMTLAGTDCVVIGAGGAARSIVHALGEAGVGGLTVVNRTVDRAHSVAALAGEAARGLALDAPEVSDVIAAAGLIINTTSVGMGGDAALPIDPAPLRAGQLMVDIIYNPAVTPLMAAAASQGARTMNGLAMLVYQAVEQLRIWTGEEPDAAVMMAAAEAVLGHG